MRKRSVLFLCLRIGRHPALGGRSAIAQFPPHIQAALVHVLTFKSLPRAALVHVLTFKSTPRAALVHVLTFKSVPRAALAHVLRCGIAHRAVLPSVISAALRFSRTWLYALVNGAMLAPLPGSIPLRQSIRWSRSFLARPTGYSLRSLWDQRSIASRLLKTERAEPACAG